MSEAVLSKIARVRSTQTSDELLARAIDPATLDPNEPFLALVQDAVIYIPLASGWQVVQKRTDKADWLWVHNDAGHMPQQGWKLHISATMISAADVLRKTLSLLLTEVVSFKVAATSRQIGILNSGQGGISQVGKFITIYPQDDDQAVRLAVALHEATLGMKGPAVPSDRPLRTGSLVHYRYGAFATLGMQNRHGDVRLAIRTPSGELVPDERLSAYSPPEWAVDPFLKAGVADTLTRPSPLVGGRYLAVTTISETPRGLVYKGVDVVGLRRCIIKEARRDGAMGTDGLDAFDRLRNEARILARLSPDPRFPQAYDLFEGDGELFLVMEEVVGESLQENVRSLAMQGRTLPIEELVEWGKELAGMLADIHAKGIIYRDLKAPNLIVAQDGHLRLIDFDVSMEIPAQRALYSPGTVGYMSWGQQAGEPPRVEHDIYSLGALLYFMATGADPSRFPHPFDLLKRPPELLNPALPASMVQIIARCLEDAPGDRFPSMQAVIDALDLVGPDTGGRDQESGVRATAGGGQEASQEEAIPQSAGSWASPNSGVPHSERPARPEEYLEIARRLGDTLCDIAHYDPSGVGCYWINPRHAEIPIVARDLATGSAGPVLALAELVAEIGESNHRHILREGARWLASQPPTAENPRPGLYNGEAGVAVALLRAGQVLNDDTLIKEAVRRGPWIAAVPFGPPGIFNGTAGRVRFHLLLWDATGDEKHLDAAIRAGEHLVESAQDAGGDPGSEMLCWAMPPGDGPHDGRIYTGYALGAAGIGDALLDLLGVTGDSRFLRAAEGAARWLEHLAMPTLNDDSGLDWPQVEGEAPKGAFWGHGASGVGIFLLNAARHGIISPSDKFLERAALTAAQGTRWAGPTLAYGLGGPIEFLLDAYQERSNRVYLEGAKRLASILQTFSVESDGHLFYPSEDSTLCTPDYIVGYAGVAVLTLRLAYPGHIPRVVTMAASRRNRLHAVHRKLVAVGRQ